MIFGSAKTLVKGGVYRSPTDFDISLTIGRYAFSVHLVDEKERAAQREPLSERALRQDHALIDGIHSVFSEDLD